MGPTDTAAYNAPDSQHCSTVGSGLVTVLVSTLPHSVHVITSRRHFAVVQVSVFESAMIPKRMAAPRGGHHLNTLTYQWKTVILWANAVMEPLPPLAPSNWKLISRVPGAQPRCSEAATVALLKP